MESGIRIVLPLLLLKNILQNTQHGKTVKERSRISLSLTTVRLAQTQTPQMSPMKNNLNDFKTQIGKRSICFLWRDLFTTRNFVTWFFKRINEVKMTTKFSYHIHCDGNCSMCISVSRCPQYQCVKYLSTGMCLSVHMHKLWAWKLPATKSSCRVRFL